MQPFPLYKHPQVSCNWSLCCGYDGKRFWSWSCGLVSAGRRAASALQPHQLISGAADPLPALGAGFAPSWEYLIKSVTQTPEDRKYRTDTNAAKMNSFKHLLSHHWHLFIVFVLESSFLRALLEECPCKNKAVWKKAVLTAWLRLGIWKWRELFLVKMQQIYAYSRHKRNSFTGCCSFLLFPVTNSTSQVNCP